MKKILSAFAIASLFCVAGCPKKTEEPKKDDTAAKPTDDKAATPTPTPEPTPTPAPPAPTDKPATDKAAAPSGDLPAECNDYKDAMTKAATCDKLGKQRDTFKKQFDESWAAWEKLDAAGKAALAQGCKTTAKAVKDATAKACP